MIRLLGALLLGAAGLACGEPLDFSNATVGYRDGRYTIHMQVLIRRPRDAVQAVLHDFGNLSRVNPALKAVTMLPPTRPGTRRMRVVAAACIVFFCRRYSWVQNVVILPSGDVETRIDPDAGDFRAGRASYRFRLAGGARAATRLIFDAELVPNFWLPPLLGPWLLKQKLHNEALETARGIERLAQPR